MGDDIPPGALYGLLVFLLICSAFFSGTETALMTLNRYRLRHKAKSGHRGAILAENLLCKPDRLISLILICNNLVNVFAVQLVTIIALRLGSPFWLAASGFIFTIVLL
ncbi:MAG: CNNM domain-containing protein, partial [Gammaproteobacteria bacterium]|nr:CNNM domain-containing protein [Gammaproteobacteria bacterium]